jgi:hypothetical protein
MVNTSNWDKFSKRIVLGLVVSAVVAAIAGHLHRRRRGDHLAAYSNLGRVLINRPAVSAF